MALNVLGFLFLLCLSVSVGDKLYTSSDPILQLNSTNFHSVLYGQKTAFVVEFYNSWCGHCIRYASTYKAVANDLVGWYPVVKIAALDCADESNFQVCREYKIPLFPTLKYFGPGLQKGDFGELVDHKVENSVLRTNIIDLLKRSHAPAEWPNLDPINVVGLQKIMMILQTKPTLLVLENDNSYIGQEVILDVSSLNVTVLRASTSNKQLLSEISRRVMITRFPALLVFHKDHIRLLVQANSESTARAEMQEAIYSLLHVSQKMHLKKQKEEFNNNKVEFTSEIDLHMVDLENTIHYLLRTEVALKETLRDHTLRDFKAFLAALTKTFPGTARTMEFLQQLYEWVNGHKDSIPTKEMSNFMDEMELKGISLPPLRDWLHCRGSRPTFRGYPCGLWSLFHTMTVGAHLKYLKGQMVNPGQVLLAIRDYVASFFSCSECATHFGQMALGMEGELRSPNATVLWLWSAHNKVNLRLAGDKTEDPTHPKVLFPTEAQCPECHSRDQTWNLDPLIAFLHNFYSANIVQDNSIDTLTQNYNGGLHFKYFSRADISLCLVLYVSSATLLLIVYFVVLLRRRQRSRTNYPV